ncbi:hypothetical protein JL720_5325 [Aureococcus anophagefferens]|nr:hypothetical protein JL720_5325 [Aureococcus anophagefferens]
MERSHHQWLEQVFFRQHLRCTRAVMRALGPAPRRVLEHGLGLVALGACGLVVYLHGTYVARTGAPLAVELRAAAAALGANRSVFAVNASYWFSRDRGVVALGDVARRDLRVPAATVRCGSGGFGQRWALAVAGADAAVANAAVAAVGPRGYVRSERSNEFYDLARAGAAPFTREALAQALTVSLKTLFLIFATSTLVSYTLRETQARMLRFAFELKENIGDNRAYLSLVASHLLDSAVFAPIMIGMMAFLFEFFADQVLGLLVLTLAWGAELFAAVSLRSRRALDHLPRLLVLYLAALHVYLFKFPFGFKYVALLAAIAAIGHAMLLFWDREVPAAARAVTNLREIPAAPPRGTGSERSAWEKPRRARQAAMIGSSSAGTLPSTHLLTMDRRRRARNSAAAFLAAAVKRPSNRIAICTSFAISPLAAAIRTSLSTLPLARSCSALRA